MDKSTKTIFIAACISIIILSLEGSHLLSGIFTTIGIALLLLFVIMIVLYLVSYVAKIQEKSAKEQGEYEMLNDIKKDIKNIRINEEDKKMAIELDKKRTRIGLIIIVALLFVAIGLVIYARYKFGTEKVFG